MASKLTKLQERILSVLAGHRLGWVLTGGGALAGFHLQHRETRDLDLFWHGQRELEELPRAVIARLSEAGLVVEVLQTAPAFRRLVVSQGVDSCVVDLVADPLPAVEPPVDLALGDISIPVDPVREIFGNKLCALLGRMELRDLIDACYLLEAGVSLEVGITDAAVKDTGFSPLTLAWVLRSFDVRAVAAAMAIDGNEIDRLVAFQDSLIKRLVAGSAEELAKL